MLAFSFSRITWQQHVVLESEAKSNEHVQIGAPGGGVTANLVDVKAASHHSLADWLHDSHGWFWLVSSNA